MGSFGVKESFARYNIGFIGGDSLSFPVLFDVDISDVVFEFFIWSNVGAEKIVDLDTDDMVIVSGDPDDIQNSLTIVFDEDATAEWTFDCAQFRLRWDVGDGFRTLIIGDIFREA